MIDNRVLITARNEVGVGLYFHRRLWFCPRGGWYPSMYCRWYPSMPCTGRGCYPSMPCSRGVPATRGVAWSGGSTRGGLLPEGWLLETPHDGHCCGRYASYWNAFLFPFFLQDHIWVIICEPCEILTRIGICGFRLFGFPTCDFLSVIKINTTLCYVTLRITNAS